MMDKLQNIISDTSVGRTSVLNVQQNFIIIELIPVVLLIQMKCNFQAEIIV